MLSNIHHLRGSAAFRHSRSWPGAGSSQELGRNPAGEVALWLLAIGFFGMALWRLTEVLFGSATVGEPQRDKRKAVTHRLTAVGKVVLYGALGYSVLEYALGTGGTQSSDTESVDLTARLLQHAGGQVLVTAGVFLFVAAVDVQPGQAKGVDSALRALAGTPAGPWLLVVVALGLIMFGVFSGCEARWRKV